MYGGLLTKNNLVKHKSQFEVRQFEPFKKSVVKLKLYKINQGYSI